MKPISLENFTSVLQLYFESVTDLFPELGFRSMECDFLNLIWCLRINERDVRKKRTFRGMVIPII